MNAFYDGVSPFFFQAAKRLKIHSLDHDKDRIQGSRMSTVDQRYSQAEKLKDSGQTEQARDLLLEILEESPEHVLSHLALARIFTSLDEHHRAVAHAEKACQLEPNEGFNYTLLSVTYQKAYAGTGETSYIRMAEDAMARSRML